MTRTHRPLLIALVALAALAVAPSAAQADVQPRIVGGTPISIDQAPFMAAIVNRERAETESAYFGQFCGGAVIHPRVVLTAAHCLVDEVPEDLAVVVGLTNLKKEGGQLVPVRQIRIHKRYNGDTSANDIALLILEENAFVPPIQPSPPHLGNFAGKQVGIFGWGTRGGRTRGSAGLRAGVQTVLSNSRCKRDWRGQTPRWEGTTRFCAIGANNFKPDTCAGDSGGPVTAAYPDGQFYVIGVTSYGGPQNGCGFPPPGVYTRVTAYFDWINRSIAAGLASRR